MRKTSILKILLILSISITCLFTWTASGICIDKPKIDLSEYRGLTSRTFTAYKYAFGGLTMGTLQLVIDPREFGFNMEWNEVYDDGVAQFLAFDYEDTAEGSFERNIVRYEVLYDWPNPPTKGDEIYRANYRDPAPPGVARITSYNVCYTKLLRCFFPVSFPGPVVPGTGRMRSPVGNGMGSDPASPLCTPVRPRRGSVRSRREAALSRQP